MHLRFSTRHKFGSKAFVGAAAVTLAASAVVLVPQAAVAGNAPPRVSHVLLISVDGMHQSDLAWYVSTHPGSELASLVASGVEYTNARTPVPADSFPGIVALTAGGDPKVSGIYYDNAYSYALDPPGTTSCAGAPLGTPVNYDESNDIDPTALDAGEGLSGLPGSILQMTGDPRQVTVPADLPVNPATCGPEYPHQYLRVNTIFEVAHSHGLRTAWSDKNPGYDLVQGPSGTGVDDLFTPEIKSNALMPDGTPYPNGVDWTLDNDATIQYDTYKVDAILNEIDGYDHSGTTKVGVPAIFGMNFQSVSTAQKLPSSDGLTGGYLPGTHTPGPLVARALDYVDTELTAMVHELAKQGLLGSTALILSSKHGNSPIDPSTLTRIDDGAIIDAIDAAWAKTHPSAPPLVAAATDDTAIQMWLSDRSQTAADFVKTYLLTHSATGNTVDGGSRTLRASGLAQVFAGAAAADYFGVPVSDSRYPSVWGVIQPGVLYTGGRGKIADHGGATPDDRDVPLLVVVPGVAHAVDTSVLEITHVAPTILALLGLNPGDLQAVQREGTTVLPGL